jgi:hypothetical protein
MKNYTKTARINRPRRLENLKCYVLSLLTGPSSPRSSEPLQNLKYYTITMAMACLFLMVPVVPVALNCFKFQNTMACLFLMVPVVPVQ